MPGPYDDPYGIGQTLWRQGSQQDTSAPTPQGGPTGYQINNQYYQPKNTQQFGASPQTIYGGGQIGAPDPNAVADSLNKVMGRKAPTIAGADFSGMGQTQGSQLGLLAQMQKYAQGLGPSAAGIGNTMAMGAAAGAGRAALGGGNALAARAGLGAQGAGLNNAALSGAQARSNESGEMMSALGKQSLGLSNNAQGASSLADLQIQQQQALGLGQAQRNYNLAQGILGNSLQEQMDIGKAGMNAYELNKQKQMFDQGQAVNYFGSAVPFVGGMITAGGSYANAANSGMPNPPSK